MERKARRARQPATTDFTVDVEGLGKFVFGRRTMADEIQMQVEYARIIDGVVPTDWLAAVVGWKTSIEQLLVRAPHGWDLNDLDPLDPESYAQLRLVHEALSEQERSFRRGPGVPREGSSQAPAGDD